MASPPTQAVARAREGLTANPGAAARRVTRSHAQPERRSNPTERLRQARSAYCHSPRVGYWIAGSCDPLLDGWKSKTSDRNQRHAGKCRRYDAARPRPIRPFARDGSSLVLQFGCIKSRAVHAAVNGCRQATLARLNRQQVRTRNPDQRLRPFGWQDERLTEPIPTHKFRPPYRRCE